jgi:hypothetical protein
LAHQATLIQLIGSSVEGAEHIGDRKHQKRPTKDLAC